MKKIPSFIFLVFIGSAVSAQLNEKILLNEDFNSNKNNWLIAESPGRTIAIADGKYIMKDTLWQDIWTGIPVAINETGSYSISANVIHKSGSDAIAYGISFGGRDAYNCYNFAIAANGSYIVYKIEKSRIFTLINWTHDKNIITGNNTINKLRLVKQGQVWQFYINNVPVNSCTAGRFFGNITGFEETHNQWAEFDDLVITELNSGAVTAPAPVIQDTLYPCQLIEKLPEFREENFVSITGSPVLNSTSQNKYYCKFAVTAATATTINYYSDNNFSFNVEFARSKTEADARKKLDAIKIKFEACAGHPYKLRDYIANASAFTINTTTGFKELGIMLAVLPDANTGEYTVNMSTSSYDKETVYEYITTPSDSSLLAKHLKKLADNAQYKFAGITGKKINTDKKTYKTYYECGYQFPGAIKNEIYELYNRFFEATLHEKIMDGDEADKRLREDFESMKNALGKGYMFAQQTIKTSQRYNFYLNDLLYHNGMISLVKEKENDGSYSIKIQVQSINQ